MTQFGDRQQDELRDLLERLRQSLDRAEAPDEETRGLLEALSDQTREVLERSEPPAGEERARLHTGLLGALERFEGTHPDLAYVIGKVVDALSGLGI